MYEVPAAEAVLTQGDIIDSCPIVSWNESKTGEAHRWEPVQSQERVLILTQSCDLANLKSSRVQVAIVHDVHRIVELGIVKAPVIRDQVRTHRVFGWYFLPDAPGTLAESIVDLRDVHTVPRGLLEDLCRQGRRIARLTTPFREHLAQHFAVTYSRIALPQPYETK